MNHLDNPADWTRLAKRIREKAALRRIYEEVYSKYEACISRCSPGGAVIEVGSGMGFARKAISGMVATDLLPYPQLDTVLDATRMPFADGSLRFIGLMDVFHHIPDVGRFLAETERCLQPGGRMLIVDQHPGWIGGPIFKYLHHEPFRPEATDWKFDSSGPLSGANGALAWIVFRRDRRMFEDRFPGLRLVDYRPHTPLRYWLSGGLKRWSLLPGWAFPLASSLDRFLVGLSSNFGSFVDIEIEKSGGPRSSSDRVPAAAGLHS
jgi:SAM-dependent methyltransferase